MCVHACVRACVRACVCACVPACLPACLPACVWRRGREEGGALRINSMDNISRLQILLITIIYYLVLNAQSTSTVISGRKKGTSLKGKDVEKIVLETGL